MHAGPLTIPPTLTSLASQCGCGAKIGAADLFALLGTDRPDRHPDLLVGAEHHDDAAVLHLHQGTGLIQTVDFFPPVVDDPYLFGAIAACNALSDVYAMGGQPLCCMAIVCFPTDRLPLEVLGEILRGGHDKIREAGALLVGGHSIHDERPKYGLAVSGTVDPAKIVTNRGGRPGDRLVLTKPLGTGLLITAKRKEACSEEDLSPALESMSTLNAAAAAAMREAGVLAATDVTGFGLLGHLYNLASASEVAAEVWLDRLPVFPKVQALASEGHLPGGAGRNRRWLTPYTEFDPACDPALTGVLFDPQTSGGLLLSVPPEQLAALKRELAGRQVLAAELGRLTAGRAGALRVRPEAPANLD